MTVDSEQIAKDIAAFEARGGKAQIVGSTVIKEMLPADVQRRLNKLNGGFESPEDTEKRRAKARSRGGRAARDSKRQNKS